MKATPNQVKSREITWNHVKSHEITWNHGNQVQSLKSSEIKWNHWNHWNHVKSREIMWNHWNHFKSLQSLFSEISCFPLGEMFFWPCGHTSNQANNFSLQDSSLREREQQQVALVWGLAQLFLVEIVPLNYQQIIYFKWICYSRSSQPYPLLAALLREDDDHTYHTLHTDPRTREKRMHI